MTRIGALIFPNLTQLDLTATHEVLARIPDTEVNLIGETRVPLRSENGLSFVPDFTFLDAPPCDVLFVPGGPGVNAAMQSGPLLTFLTEQAEHAQWVTSVCTGALVLGAAGLLRGYRATTHWLSLDVLETLGATPVRERVVVDRNRVTGGGVTAGLDFGLRLAAELRGGDVAQEIQLMLEYDPDPPFQSGSPNTANPELVERIRRQRQPVQAERRELAVRAAARLRAEG
jgi:cyclohexyl-isocyanide hydratase